MMDLFCDTILPGDDALGLPSGSAVDLAGYAAAHGAGDQIEAGLKLIDDVARDMFGSGFAEIGPDDRLQCIEKGKRKDVRLVTAVIVHCLKAYYTHPDVLGRISAGAVPPFPEGNTLDNDDWSILEPVYERGPIYRPVA